MLNLGSMPERFCHIAGVARIAATLALSAVTFGLLGCEKEPEPPVEPEQPEEPTGDDSGSAE